MITAKDILTSSGKYPEREKLASTADLENARETADCFNACLDELGYTGPRKSSSGFRPPTANAAAGGTKASLHMKAMAVDFETQEIGLFVRRHPQGAAILRKHGIFMEALEHTKSWTHWDRGTRADRPNREFKP